MAELLNTGPEQESRPIQLGKEMARTICNEFNPLEQNEVIKQIFDFVLKERKELINQKNAELLALNKTFEELIILNK